MKLSAFKVLNYRCIEETEWVEVDDICCIVGKNESGKTSLLHALWKFNPYKKHPYSLDREWPRGRRRDRSLDAKVVSCRFAFTADELEKIHDLDTSCEGIESVQITRDYRGKYWYSFLPLHPTATHPVEWVVSVLNEQLGPTTQDTSQHFSEKYGELFDAFVSEVRGNGGSEYAVEQLPTFKGQIATHRSPNQPEYPTDDAAITELQGKVDVAISRLKESPPGRKAIDTVHEWLPTFIYMDDYRAFSGGAQLDEVKKRREQGKLTDEDETIVLIMEQAGLDLDEQVELANTEDKEQRMLDMNDASLTLTNELSDRWTQKQYAVRFEADGDHLMMFVQDFERPVMVPLEERSKGFQWFFSFDMMFMAETGGKFQNAVILLDEPGLHLHAAAQKDLLRRMEAYSGKNQLVYSTHLPFMVDPSRLDKVYVCEETDNGSKTHQNWSAADKDARFTLQAALGLSWSQSLFVGKYNLVVEGVTDFWYLSMFSNLLASNGEEGLDEELVITPAGGASKVAYIGTVLRGQELDVCVLLDSDSDGEDAYKQLVHQWLIEDKLALRLGPLLAMPSPMEIEDLFDVDYFLGHAQMAYAKELGRKKISLMKGDTRPIVDRIESGLAEKGISRFNKGRVAKRILRDAAEKSIDDYDKNIVERFRKVIFAINEIVTEWKSN